MHIMCMYLFHGQMWHDESPEKSFEKGVAVCKRLLREGTESDQLPSEFESAGMIPISADTFSDCADFYRQFDKLDRALELYEECLRMKKATLGEVHSSLAITLNDIAVVYDTKGEYDKALELYEECLRMTKATLGEEHSDVATTLANMGQVYKTKGEYDKAVGFIFSNIT